MIEGATTKISGEVPVPENQQKRGHVHREATQGQRRASTEVSSIQPSRMSIQLLKVGIIF